MHPLHTTARARVHAWSSSKTSSRHCLYPASALGLWPALLAAQRVFPGAERRTRGTPWPAAGPIQLVRIPLSRSAIGTLPKGVVVLSTRRCKVVVMGDAGNNVEI